MSFFLRYTLTGHLEKGTRRRTNETEEWQDLCFTLARIRERAFRPSRISNWGRFLGSPIALYHAFSSFFLTPGQELSAMSRAGTTNRTAYPADILIVVQSPLAQTRRLRESCRTSRTHKCTGSLRELTLFNALQR